MGEKREKLLSIEIPEKPGSFLKLCNIFGGTQITEFNYRLADQSIANVLVGVKTKDEDAFKVLASKLKKSKFKYTDLTNNQISNDHLRYMVGGHNSSFAEDGAERLFRCQFPERPRALLKFLNDFGTKWNISVSYTHLRAHET